MRVNLSHTGSGTLAWQGVLDAILAVGDGTNNELG